MPSYTLDELLKLMEPQAQRDKALINQCIEGLGLYAAQQRQDSFFSSKPDEMRKLVENLIGYWGLDDNEYAPSLEDYLDAFDEKIFAAKSDEEITGATYRRQADTIYGLHRYGEEMVVAQGDSAMSEILDIGDLMKEIALYWDFQPYAAVVGIAEQLRAEVRTMLDGITLPGQPSIGENAGYEIKQAILFGNDRGFALAHNPNTPAPFVTWQFTYDANDSSKRSYYWGRYVATEDRAQLNYLSRVADYIESYKVTEKPIPVATEMSVERQSESAAESGSIPVRVLSVGQPLVTVTFSEHDQLRGVDKMPLYLVDALFVELDEKHMDARRQPGYDGAPYLKTDYRIDFVMDGKPDSYIGRYDVGDDDGSLLDRIYHYNEYSRRDDDYQKYLADKGGSVQETENAKLDVIINKLVPFFETHCELSLKEAAALSELMGIHEAAAVQPSEDYQPRIAYLESVVDYAWRARKALNTTGIDGLPEAPQSAVEAGNGTAVRDSEKKLSILDQIKAAREAPKPPAKPKPERDKKQWGPDL